MATARSVVAQELSTAYVREIFKHLESGDGKGFFDHVSDDVDWTVEGTHPLAGHYHSKAEFVAHTFEKLGKVTIVGLISALAQDVRVEYAQPLPQFGLRSARQARSGELDQLHYQHELPRPEYCPRP